jgi:hypothetical protein
METEEKGGRGSTFECAGIKTTGFGPLFSADSGRLISASCEGGGTPPFVTRRWDGAGDIH